MYGIRADQAFDGERAIQGGALVLVEEGVILAVEPGTSAAPDGCTVSYLPGSTVLPGLIDTHSHLCGNDESDAFARLSGLSAAELDATIDAALTAQLAAGVTTVRDLGDQQWAVVDRHRRRSDGPRVVASGPPLTSVGGHCAGLGGAARGITELRRAVQQRAERGADLVKIMATGDMTAPTMGGRACQFELDELRAVVEEAHRLGLPVAAHAHATVGVQQCVDAGVDGIEHCTCLDANGSHTPPELAEAIAAAGILVGPTLGHDLSALARLVPLSVSAQVQPSGSMVDDRLAQVGELYRGGVSMISGVDSGVGPAKRHGTLALAVSELVAAGVPAATALASATSLAARACGLAGRTGRLRAGFDADLLVVEGDPTIDIAAIGNTRTVVSRGQVQPSECR